MNTFVNASAPESEGMEAIAATSAECDPPLGHRVRQIHLDLKTLSDKGTFVAVHACGLSMFTVGADLVELGVPRTAQRAITGRYQPGHKTLIPKCVLEPFERLARGQHDALAAHALDIEIARPYRWLSAPRWADWHAGFVRAQAEWTEARERLLIAPHSELVRNAIDTFEATATESYRSIIAQGETPDVDERAFVGDVVRRVLRQFPSIERIRRRVLLDYDVGLLFHSARLAELSEAEAQARLAEAAARQRAAEHDAATRLIEARGRIDAEAAECEAREQMETQRFERLVAQIAAGDTPLEEAIEALRTRAAADAERLLTKLRGDGRLNSKAWRTLREMVTDFTRDDVGDASLQMLMSQLQGEIDSPLSLGLVDILDSIRRLARGTREVLAGVNFAIEGVAPTHFRCLCLACRHVAEVEQYGAPDVCAACGATGDQVLVVAL